MKVYDPDLISPDPEIRRLDHVLRRVGDEVLRARDKFAAFNSPHEGYAVIKEELDELWSECKANRGRTSDAITEAVQVAAMAVRYACDLAERSANVEETSR